MLEMISTWGNYKSTERKHANLTLCHSLIKYEPLF